MTQHVGRTHLCGGRQSPQGIAGCCLDRTFTSEKPRLWCSLCDLLPGPLITGQPSSHITSPYLCLQEGLFRFTCEVRPPRTTSLLINSTSVAKSCQTLCDLWTAAHQASLSFAISQSLLKLMTIESVMPSNCLILCRPLLLPSIFPSIRFSSSESAL